MIVWCDGSATCKCGATGCPRACTSDYYNVDVYYNYNVRVYDFSQNSIREFIKSHLVFINAAPLVEITPNYMFVDKYVREAKRVRRSMLSIQRVYSTKIKRNKKSILL